MGDASGLMLISGAVVNAGVLAIVGHVARQAVRRTDAVPVIEQRLTTVEETVRVQGASVAKQLEDGFRRIERRLDLVDSHIASRPTIVQHDHLVAKVERIQDQLNDVRVHVAELRAAEQGGE